jgi:hypothetical protein
MIEQTEAQQIIKYRYDPKSPQYKSFISWLKDAPPNDKFVYFEGEFVPMRYGSFVWDKALTGHVYLVQKRIAIGEFQYIAIRADRVLRSLIPYSNPKSQKRLKVNG